MIINTEPLVSTWTIAAAVANRVQFDEDSVLSVLEIDGVHIVVTMDEIYGRSDEPSCTAVFIGGTIEVNARLSKLWNEYCETQETWPENPFQACEEFVDFLTRSNET
jgi:hypothetical protein